MGCSGSVEAPGPQQRDAPRRYEVAPANATAAAATYSSTMIPAATPPMRRASAVATLNGDDDEYQLLVEVDRMSSTSGGFTTQEPSRTAQRHLVASRMREARQRESGSGICPHPLVVHAPGELERVNSRVREWFPSALAASGSAALQPNVSSNSFSWVDTQHVSTSTVTAAGNNHGHPSASEFPPSSSAAAAAATDTASNASHVSRLSRANLAAHLQSSGSSAPLPTAGNVTNGRLADDPPHVLQ